MLLNFFELRVTVYVKLTLHLLFDCFFALFASNRTFFIAFTLLPLFVAARVHNFGLIILEFNGDEITHAQLLHFSEEGWVIFTLLWLLLGLDLAAPWHDFYHVLSLSWSDEVPVFLQSHLLFKFSLLLTIVVRRFALTAFSKRVLFVVVVHLGSDSL